MYLQKRGDDIQFDGFFWVHSPSSDLVGGLEQFLFFHSVGNVIIPTDELHHFSEG